MLIKDATIVTQNQSREIVQGDILVSDGKIVEVGTGISGDEIIDARGKIAMPGLVNTHTHLAMTLLRGYGSGLPLEKWLREKIWPAEAEQSPEDVELASKLAFCEMIRSGTTAFAEMCIHDTKPVFEAAKEAGLRGIIAKGVLDLGDSDKTDELMDSVKPTFKYGDEMVKPSVAAHSPNTCSEELLLKTKELARQNNLKYQIHVGETRKEVFDVQKKTGRYPFEYLEQVMDEDSIFVHAGWLTKREIELAGKKKVAISSCPISNLKLATGGIAQITELDMAGALVTLGTDSAASNNCLDMWQTMKMAALLQSHHYWDANVISPQKILDFATINGAKAIGSNAGSIEPGRDADIILLEKGPNLVPEHDPACNLVYSAGQQNVTDVIIAGRIIMKNRKILSLDEDSVLENVKNT